MKVLIDDIRTEDGKAAFDAVHGASKLIGSSRIGAICGLNKHYSPLKVWAEMLGRIEPDPENDDMWLGKELQPVIGRLFSRRRGLRVIERFSVFGCDEAPYAIATPDFEVENGRPLETKNTGSWAKELWAEGPSDTALCQVQWQMGVMEKRDAYAAALIGGRASDFVSYEVPFAPEIFGQLKAKAENFLKMVEAQIPPEATHIDTDLIDLLTGKPVAGKRIEVPAENCDSFLSFRDITAKKKELDAESRKLDKELKALKGSIKLLAGDAGLIRCADIEIEIKERVRAGYPVAPTSWTEYKIIGKEG